MRENFDEGYFEGGSRSNYTSYRGKKFTALASELIRFGVRPTDKVVDFGCATGALIFELRRQGIDKVRGTDISTWAIESGKEMYALSSKDLQYYNLQLLTERNDWILALDVLEHIPDSELDRFFKLMEKYPPSKGFMVRVPVSENEGEDFVLDVSKNDRSHIQIHSRDWWLGRFSAAGFKEFYAFTGTTIYDSKGVLAGIMTREKVLE